jgi:predicted dehydrogenase/threonine dehydrogenase-like Zn-dependent dehydrogenase
MKQALIKKGKVYAEEVPAPVVEEGHVLIKVVNSCISVGTELSGVTSSGESLIKKALKQPEKVKKVIEIAKTEGILSAYQKIKGKLESGSPTGYSVSGVVIGVGKGIKKFKVGDKVAAAGAQCAHHAEYVSVPENLVVKIPEGLSFEEASTVTLGAIALQGVRRIDLRLGEFCVVMGTGLLGLLALQMLKASGIRVIAVDIDERRLAIAKKLGAELIINSSKEDPVKVVINYTGGYGADGVLFTAATPSSEPLSQAFNMTRKKGKVVLVGVAGNPMSIKREDMYSKELDFLISTSYGPGRYDKYYEEKGCDYPYAYVRWTENRNMQEYLRLLSIGAVNVKDLIEKVYPIEKVTEAFEFLMGSSPRPLMVILSYGELDEGKLREYFSHERRIYISKKFIKKDRINIALIGAGGFATGMHLPILSKLKDKYNLYAVVNRTGHKAKAIAQQFGAVYATTNYREVLEDENVDLILICTRHDSHASLTLSALKAGKHVFVEKPLATNEEELKAIEDFFQNAKNPPVLFVGFNRRFSKYAQEIKRHTSQRINPLFIRYRMNAGYIPLDHWVHENGGRIVGEACHIIDLMTFFTEGRIISVCVEELTPKTDYYSNSDNKSIILKYEDGSVAHIDYFAVGSKEYPKEHMEVHFDGKTIVLDDYKSLKGYGVKVKEIETSKSDKGWLEEWKALYGALKDGKWPIEFWDMVQTTRVSFLIAGV